VYYVSLVFTLYMIWPMTSQFIVGGVQGRYFIPIFPILLLVFAKKDGLNFLMDKFLALRKMNPEILFILWTMFGLIISTKTIITRYYLL
ncbi:MAG: hypothetical protein FWE89_03250, partial [Syntrophaceae bacterium]|nr:hypothetical protein [Syntrophaceae bacterium]